LIFAVASSILAFVLPPLSKHHTVHLLSKHPIHTFVNSSCSSHPSNIYVRC